MDSLTPIRCWPAIISLVITLTIWFVIPCPPDVTPQAWHLLALFIGTIAAFIGKAMPIGAIAIVAIMLVAMTGVTNPGKPSAALNDALSGFSNQLIWLIGLSIMLSQSLLKTGLGARIGYGFIALFGKRTLGIDPCGNANCTRNAKQYRAWRRHYPPGNAGDCGEPRLAARPCREWLNGPLSRAGELQH